MYYLVIAENRDVEIWTYRTRHMAMIAKDGAERLGNDTAGPIWLERELHPVEARKMLRGYIPEGTRESPDGPELKEIPKPRRRNSRGMGIFEKWETPPEGDE